MTYLDCNRLSKIDPKMFRAQEPFPWLNPEGLLTDEGYQRLQETLPDVSLFERRFDSQRKYGQKSHDRYMLEWRTDPPVARPWKEFVAELEGRVYRTFLESLLETSAFSLNFHLHYTPNGCSVSQISTSPGAALLSAMCSGMPAVHAGRVSKAKPALRCWSWHRPQAC